MLKMLRTWRVGVCAIACTAAIAGCNRVAYINRAKAPTGVSSSTTGHFFLWGLVGEKTVLAYQSCPQGVSAVNTKFSVGNVVFTVLTGGLYSPRTYIVDCGQ